MSILRRWAFALNTAACLGAVTGPAGAHFNMLLPERPSVRRGETVAVLYQWGHPFEHQLFDAPLPERLVLIGPDGKKSDLQKYLEKTDQPTTESKAAVAYKFRFTPEQRGDHVFLLTTPPIWMEEDQEFLQDIVKVILHVQVQKGWDAMAREPFELVPLTRPYGLEPCMVFQVQALAEGKPHAGGQVEIERYSPAPPRELPPDEQITRVVKTDPNGVATCTFTEAGWWSITAERDHGRRERNGKAFPVRQRSTVWVFVDEVPPRRLAR